MKEAQTYNKDTLLFSISRMLERASYYGLRSLIVLYMTSEILKMEKSEALTIYGWFTASIIFSHIIGGLLGDLVIGNKKSIIIGGLLQTIGAFSFCIPSTTGLYIGLFLVVLGGGLYTPNIISNFGKLYLRKTKLLDSRFTLFYLAVNVGSFLGITLIGYLGYKYGFNSGFIVVGILVFLTIIPILFTKEKNPTELCTNKLPISNKVTYISIALILVGLFWALFDISQIRLHDIEYELSRILTYDITNNMWQSLNSVFLFPLSIIAFIIWNYLYSSQFFKLMIGFIFGAASFGVLLLIPDAPGQQHIFFYLTCLILLSVSEVHIIPVIHSVLTQYSNPKYLAILISLSIIPVRMFPIILRYFNEGIYNYPTIGVIIGFIGMSVLGIGLFIYILINKKQPTMEF